jgi:hypothetical protein
MLTKISATVWCDKDALPGQIYRMSASAGTVTATRLAVTGTSATQTETFTEATDGKLDDIAVKLGGIKL